MKKVAVYEAKTRLCEWLAEVAKGAQITITRRGLPVARLVRTEVARRGVTSQHEHVADVIQNLSKLRKGVLLDGNAGDLIGRGRD